METINSGKRLLYLAAGLIIIALFMYGVGPAVRNLSDTFRQLSKYIDQHEIETGAYVYTDLELTAQAVVGARSTLEHQPTGPKQ